MNNLKSIEGIRMFMNNSIVKYNKDNNKNVPLIMFDIKINGRLTRCLARYRFYNTNNKIVPHSFEFSRKMIDGIEDIEHLKGIILHELGHYIAGHVHKDDCCHDERWVDIVDSLGGISTPTTKINLKSRYEFICPTHGVLKRADRLSQQYRNSAKKGWMTCKQCGCKIYIQDTKMDECIGANE